MYHPTRGGVRGGRDQFSWDEVKADKHRENYLGHSIKAPVGRWQKGKDLHWYAKDKKGGSSNTDAMKDEIKRIKEEEEQAMREALGLAPKSSTRPQGSRLDKHEYSELVKRGSTAEDLGAGKADAVWVHGIGYAKAPRPWEDPSTLSSLKEDAAAALLKDASGDEAVEDGPAGSDSDQKKVRHEERRPAKREKEERHERREKRARHEKRRTHDSDDKKKHKKEKKDRKRRHDSDSD